MQQPDWAPALQAAYNAALEYLDELPARPVAARGTLADLRAKIDMALPSTSSEPAEVIRDLVQATRDGLVAEGSGRFFGFVIGGATPAAMAADWLTSVWDQNAGLYVAGPAAAVVEEVAARWVLELLGLPEQCTVAFVTGAQMATFTGLAAARHHLLAQRGWNVEVDGLADAPRITVLAGGHRHTTIDRALRYLGLGTASLVALETDEQGRLRPTALAAALGSLGDGPVIICTQSGDVDTGACDPFIEVCDLAQRAGAWVHVDGAVGLWAAASPTRRGLLTGFDRADSWTTDAHKWLNVPYDSGIAIVRHRDAHRAAMGTRASYLVHAAGDERDSVDYTPEFSRRARGFAVYAALRALGASGVADLVDRCCDHARSFARALDGRDGITVLNDVVLNQVLVGFTDADAYAVAERIRADGTCFMTATRFDGRPALRISVSNWTTDESDVDASVAAILTALAQVRGGTANGPAA
jgi:glutamate/tyrosine decarboxylase-like PLP-dependent enzyme